MHGVCGLTERRLAWGLWMDLAPPCRDRLRISTVDAQDVLVWVNMLKVRHDRMQSSSPHMVEVLESELCGWPEVLSHARAMCVGHRACVPLAQLPYQRACAEVAPHGRFEFKCGPPPSAPLLGGVRTGRGRR
eukprot:186681-Chlamydomonas_euryale.AAC.1